MADRGFDIVALLGVRLNIHLFVKEKSNSASTNWSKQDIRMYCFPKNTQ